MAHHLRFFAAVQVRCDRFLASEINIRALSRALRQWRGDRRRIALISMMSKPESHQCGSPGPHRMEADENLGWLELHIEPERSARPAELHLDSPEPDDPIGDDEPVIAADVEMVDERLARHRIERLKAVSEAKLLLVEDAPIDFNEGHHAYAPPNDRE